MHNDASDFAALERFWLVHVWMSVQHACRVNNARLPQGWSESPFSRQFNAGILVNDWWKPLHTRWLPKQTSNFANFEIAGNFERSFAAPTGLQPQTLPICFSDDSPHLVCRYQKRKLFDMLANVQVSCDLQRMVLFRLKLCQDAFQTIPNISVFDTEKRMGEDYGI